MRSGPAMGEGFGQCKTPTKETQRADSALYSVVGKQKGLRL